MKLLKYIPYVNIIGAMFVSLNQPVLANVLWSMTNPLLTYSNYKHWVCNPVENNKIALSQSRMYCVFFVIAVLGLVREVII